MRLPRETWAFNVSLTWMGYMLVRGSAASPFGETPLPPHQGTRPHLTHQSPGKGQACI